MLISFTLLYMNTTSLKRYDYSILYQISLLRRNNLSIKMTYYMYDKPPSMKPNLFESNGPSSLLVMLITWYTDKGTAGRLVAERGDPVSRPCSPLPAHLIRPAHRTTDALKPQL